MTLSRNSSALTRRAFLASGAALGGAALLGPSASRAVAAAPLLTVEPRTIEVGGRAAKVFAVVGPNGRPGIFATEGDRLSGALLNASGTPLQMHWHGQILAPPDQDRARPGGAPLASGQGDAVDFPLTPGTHWMHSHSLTEQQLLAAPLIAREKDAGDVQDVVVMLHDFAFRSPEEILAELAGVGGHGAAAVGHGMHGANMPQSMPGMDGGVTGGHGMGDHGMTGQPVGSQAMGNQAMGNTAMGGAGHTMGMTHANDVRYDAFLANARTLADPEVVRVETGGRVRLRIVNGATATAFFVSTPGLAARCIAVDGSPCAPLAAEAFPLAQGQRIDLLAEIPAGGGAFPVLAQVEAAPFRTGIVLATADAAVARLEDHAAQPQGLLDLAFETRLRATQPLDPRRPDRSFTVMLGEEPGYRWTIDGRVHGEHRPFDVRQGERVEMTFLNPTSMMHPMHLHGHHFQVVAIGGQRFSGPVRDTVAVPPRIPVTIAFDAGQKGDWYLHCHHLYHMATGMMTEVRVA